MATQTRTISDLKDGIAGILSGSDLDDVTNLYKAIERGARQLVQKAYIPSAMARSVINLYDGVTAYPATSTIFENEIVDLRPQGDARTFLDYVSKKPAEQLDRTKSQLSNGYMVAFEYDGQGNQILRVVQTKARGRVTLDSCAATTGWSVIGNASALALDQTVYYSPNAALRLTLGTSGTSGGIEKSTISSTNLTDYSTAGSIFVAIQLPSATSITAVTLRLGSSSTAYYELTASAGFLGSFIVGDFLLVRLSMATKTTTGVPDITKITYARVLFTTDASSQPNVYIGALFAALPSPHLLLSQSAAFFIPSGSTTPQKTISKDSDTVILGDAAYTLFEHEAAMAIAVQQHDTAAIKTLTRVLYGDPMNKTAEIGLYPLYRGENPNEALRTVGNWYDD